MFIGDAVSVAKRNLKAGDILDGEGGTTVWGKLIPASKSISLNALPIGLAHNVKLINDISEGQVISQKDISAISESNAYTLRKEMEADFIESQKIEI